MDFSKRRRLRIFGPVLADDYSPFCGRSIEGIKLFRLPCAPVNLACTVHRGKIVRCSSSNIFLNFHSFMLPLFFGSFFALLRYEGLSFSEYDNRIYHVNTYIVE